MAKSAKKVSSLIFYHIALCTGKDIGMIRQDCEDNLILDSAAALEYGLVDTIVSRRE